MSPDGLASAGIAIVRINGSPVGDWGGSSIAFNLTIRYIPMHQVKTSEFNPYFFMKNVPTRPKPPLWPLPDRLFGTNPAQWPARKFSELPAETLGRAEPANPEKSQIHFCDFSEGQD